MILTKTDGIIFGIVCCLMAVDFLSGTMAAIGQHNWKSKIMRQGLLHKCSLLLCIALGAVLNVGQRYLDMGISVPAYQFICGYIAVMEAGSAVENICKANPKLVPQKIKAVLGLLKSEEDSNERTEGH